jgi:hypothetical protein
MFTRVHAAGRRHAKTKKAHGLARAGPEGNPILLIVICLWCANGELRNPGEGVLGPRPMAAGQRTKAPANLVPSEPLAESTCIHTVKDGRC